MNKKHPLQRKRKKGNTAQLAAQLAPLEEQDAQAAGAQQGPNGSGAHHDSGRQTLIQERGALIVNTDSLTIMQGLGEKKSGKEGLLGIEPVVLYILIGALLFIAFIAWQISEMPSSG